eukprot:CAMPEP_0115547668 /NCGR_PEP_ID=MMETSP0271-20121206/93765_1 /TAXON_ID=71861 /ORGANISM="Scrippsiella trochoidea, Strain CCMP3099" /LENGTH=351 /DNA_ID=CAMNT_0002981107 /DNA_START=58 /DNA_END=1113 /DNA_ORIENTATION=-
MKSASYDKAQDLHEILGQIQMPTLPQKIKTVFRRSSRSVGPTICIPVVATGTVTCANADANRRRTPSPDQCPSASAALAHSSGGSGGTGNGSGVNSNSDEIWGGSALSQCAPIPMPSRFPGPTLPKMARPRVLSRRRPESGRYLNEASQSAGPLMPTRSPSGAPGAQSPTCTSRLSLDSGSVTGSVGPIEVGSSHANPGCGPQSRCRSEMEGDDDDAALPHRGVFASDVRMRMASGSSGSSTSTVHAEEGCSEGCRKSKLEPNKAMAAKCMTSALCSASAQQPSIRLEAEYLEGRPGYKPPPKANKEQTLDQVILQSSFRFDLDSEGPAVTDLQKAEEAQNNDPFDLSIDF